jgi:hypothetical protein
MISYTELDERRGQVNGLEDQSENDASESAEILMEDVSRLLPP